MMQNINKRPEVYCKRSIIRLHGSVSQARNIRTDEGIWPKIPLIYRSAISKKEGLVSQLPNDRKGQ